MMEKIIPNYQMMAVGDRQKVASIIAIFPEADPQYIVTQIITEQKGVTALVDGNCYSCIVRSSLANCIDDAKLLVTRTGWHFIFDV